MTYGGTLRPTIAPGTRKLDWSDLEWLVASERIKQAKARYCYCLDIKDWDGYAAVYAEDAVLEVPAHGDDGPHRVEGRTAIRNFVMASVDSVVTTHQCHAPVIDFVSTREALVAWPMEDMLRFPDNYPLKIKTLHGMGHYFERYRRIGDDWLIAHNLLARLRLEVT